MIALVQSWVGNSTEPAHEDQFTGTGPANKPFRFSRLARRPTGQTGRRARKLPFLLVSRSPHPYIGGIEDCERLCLRALGARQISFNVDIPAVECLGGEPND
jgi:hypothetical protein